MAISTGSLARASGLSSRWAVRDVRPKVSFTRQQGNLGPDERDPELRAEVLEADAGKEVTAGFSGVAAHLQYLSRNSVGLA